MNEAIVKQIGPVTTVRFYRWVLLIVPLLLLVGVYFASGLIERVVLLGLVALSLVFFVFYSISFGRPAAQARELMSR